MLKDLVLKNRSYRRFREDRPVPDDTLRELVELARCSPSGGNVQPLKFILSSDAKRNAAIFPHLAWAGYLKDWPGPAEGERPTAYVIVLHDTQMAGAVGCDHGIAAQSILLGATEKGLGGCMIGSVDRDGLQRDLKIDPRFKVLLVIALGVPAETVRIDPVTPETGIRYWRDEADVHHVPKRSLDELLIEPA